MLCFQPQKEQLIKIELKAESSLPEEKVGKQKYSHELGKYKDLWSSETFDSDEQEELAKLQMTTENIKSNLAKVKEVKKYWGDKVQVHMYVTMCILIIIITSRYVVQIQNLLASMKTSSLCTHNAVIHITCNGTKGVGDGVTSEARTLLLFDSSSNKNNWKSCY